MGWLLLQRGRGQRSRSGAKNFAIGSIGGVVRAGPCAGRSDRAVTGDRTAVFDVGEETGELDTMLYKVADIFDEEVSALTDGLMKLIEPLLICFLGGAVGFIVIALFMPLISLIQGLS